MNALVFSKTNDFAIKIEYNKYNVEQHHDPSTFKNTFIIFKNTG